MSVFFVLHNSRTFVFKVPAMWSNAAYPSLKPLGSWVKDLLLRCMFIEVSNVLFVQSPVCCSIFVCSYDIIA